MVFGRVRVQPFPVEVYLHINMLGNRRNVISGDDEARRIPDSFAKRRKQNRLIIAIPRAARESCLRCRDRFDAQHVMLIAHGPRHPGEDRSSLGMLIARWHEPNHAACDLDHGGVAFIVVD